MPGSSTSSSSWMLPLLLLPLFISFHQASSASLSPCNKSMHEFNSNMNDLGKIVKNCLENCSLANITDTTCRCLNLSVSQGECACPQYFITGLKSLLHKTSNQRAIKLLIRRLEIMRGTCQEKHFCSLSVNYETEISPKTFHDKLKVLTQHYNMRVPS